MSVEIIIPARLESRRLPRKLLYTIAGRPVLWWTWQAAQRAGYRVTIATDSPEIQQAALRWGARVGITEPAANGTERCARALGWPAMIDATTIINWQGDAPLIPAEWVGAMLDHLGSDPGAEIATIGTFGHASAGSVAISIGKDGYAESFDRVENGDHLLHHGIYAYRRDALALYGRCAEGRKEREAGLEQIRLLGRCPIAVIERLAGSPMPEVNLAADLEAVAAELERTHAAV